MSSPLTPASEQAATAARAFSRLCAPLMGRSARADGRASKPDQAVPRAGVQAVPADRTEADDGTARQRLHLPTCRVVAVQHCEVPRALAVQDSRLRCGVLFEGSVAVQMVGRDVEDDCHAAAEGRARLELEAGELQDVPVVRLRRLHDLQHGRADVAGERARHARRAQHVVGERGRGRLSVGSGDADDAPPQDIGGKLQLPAHGDAPLARADQAGQVPGHAGRRDHQILGQHQLVRVAAVADRRGQRVQRLGIAAEALAGTAVGCGDDCALTGEKARRRPPGPAQADHQRSLAVDVHRSFSVLSASSAQAKPAIQKRTITFDSAQPSSSK